MSVWTRTSGTEGPRRLFRDPAFPYEARKRRALRSRRHHDRLARVRPSTRIRMRLRRVEVDRIALLKFVRIGAKLQQQRPRQHMNELGARVFM